MTFGGTAAPAGWLLCYGQAVSRTTYALLFAVIGIAYGSGDGATTFNLPDLRGRASIGADNMGGSAANRVTQAVSGILATSLGQGGGDQHAQTDTLTADSTASSTVSDPSHLHTINTNILGGSTSSGEITGNSGAAGVAGATQPAYTNISVSTSVSTTVTSSLTGGSQNMPPVQVSNMIIFTGITS
jgi:microcystin-dependent protein